MTSTPSTPGAEGTQPDDQGSPPQVPDPDLDSFYDHGEAGPACLVCGALVPSYGDFRRVHWDWHEASNGA